MTAVLVAVVAAAGVAALGAGTALSRGSGGNAAPTSAGGLRGDIAWAAASRHAPAIALADASGQPFSLARERGRVVLLTFLDSRCRALCPLESRMLAKVARSLPVADRPDVVVVSVDPSGDTAASVRHAERDLAGVRRVTWLVGSRARLARVWRAYGVEVKPVPGDIEHTSVVYVIDRRGDERVGMLFPFSPPSLSHDLRLLAAERAA
jgi:protein SCO1/2